MDHDNINRIWADLLVEECVRSGVGLFCLAPGSRSTPLATAVAANPRASHVMHFDERGTAFCALGYARATRRPAAWITTSGTAVANGMPAVVEASVDGVPLLLVTADRPPELRSTGANQTIDQVKMFGDYVRWQFDLPAPTSDVEAAVVLTTADQAVYRTRRSPAGPVHLNAMFREPLAPDPDGGEYTAYLNEVESWRESGRPYTRYHQLPAGPVPSEMDALWARLRHAERGLVVAGRLDTPAQADAVRWLSDLLGWPLLPDACSQLRMGGPHRPDHVVPYVDLVLTSAAFRREHRPDAVLYVGGRCTSKRLNAFLGWTRAPAYVVVRDAPDRIDPYHRVTDHVESDVVTFCQQFAAQIDQDRSASEDDAGSRTAWARAWTDASGLVGRALDGELSAELSEPAATRHITRHAREGAGVVLASSMPVRDADMAGHDDGGAPFVAANRGASGIDGTVATAAGLARGLDREVTLLIGDLALLHDLNSLALLGDAPHPLFIVAINNHGGGIFSFLPIARHEAVFEPYFGTPHTWSFEHAARMFGLDYYHPETLDDLAAAYQQAHDRYRSCIIEVTTDRRENAALHRRLEALADDVLA